MSYRGLTSIKVHPPFASNMWRTSRDGDSAETVCPQSPPPHYSSFCATEQFSPVLWQQTWRYSKSWRRVKGGRCRCSCEVNRKCPAGWRRSVRSFREVSERKDQKWAEQLWQMFQDPQIKTNVFDDTCSHVFTHPQTLLCVNSPTMQCPIFCTCNHDCWLGSSQRWSTLMMISEKS